jgi:hypothetical protein
MSVPSREVTRTAEAHRIVTDVQAMVRRYGQTFIELVVGKRSDTDALLDFYAAPLRFDAKGHTDYPFVGETHAVTANTQS